jgi:hypothetical protein
MRCRGGGLPATRSVGCIVSISASPPSSRTRSRIWKHRVHGEGDRLKRRRDATSSTLQVVAGAGLQGESAGTAQMRRGRRGDALPVSQASGDAQPHAQRAAVSGSRPQRTRTGRSREEGGYKRPGQQETARARRRAHAGSEPRTCMYVQRMSDGRWRVKSPDPPPRRARRHKLKVEEQ